LIDILKCGCERSDVATLIAMADQSHAAISKATGLPRLTVFRIRKDVAATEAELGNWNM